MPQRLVKLFLVITGPLSLVDMAKTKWCPASMAHREFTGLSYSRLSPSMSVTVVFMAAINLVTKSIYSDNSIGSSDEGKMAYDRDTLLLSI
jgi:hypothetical protein